MKKKSLAEKGKKKTPIKKLTDKEKKKKKGGKAIVCTVRGCFWEKEHGGW